MALITGSLGGVMGGVSQQPDILRYPGQCSEQENMWLDPVHGIRRRKPLRDIATLDSVITDGELYEHWFSLEGVTYIAVLTPTSIKVYDLDGTEYTTHGTDYAYLQPNFKKEYISAVQLGEYNVFSTTQCIPAMSASIPDADEYLVFHVYSGMEWGLTYTILHNGVSVASFTTPDGTSVTPTTIAQIESTYVAAQLHVSLNSAISSQGWVTTLVGNCIVCRRLAADVTSSYTPSLFSSTDGRGSTAIRTTIGEIQSLSDLPPAAFPNHWVRVRGTTDTSVDDFYMKFEASSVHAEGVWVETADQTEPLSLSPTTLPHALVRAADGDFYFACLNGQTLGGSLIDTWASRKAGDSESNPVPAFVGTPVTALGMVQNRLLMITDDHVVMSKVRAEFTYWADSALKAIDTDPIDLTTPGTEKAELFAALEHDQFMVILGARRQFAIPLRTALTTKTAALVPTTTYEIAKDCVPTVAGSSVFFAFKQSGYTGVREYKAALTVDNVMTADNITAHVDKYLPENIKTLHADTQNGIILALGDTDHKLWVFQFVDSKEQRVVEGWHDLTLPYVVPRGVKVIAGEIYILATCPSGLRLYAFNQEEDAIFLDYQMSGTVASGVIDTSAWNFRPAPLEGLQVVLTSGVYTGMRVQIESKTDTSITLKEKSLFEGATVAIGLTYTSNYTPTMPVIRDNAGKARLQDTLTVGNLDVFVHDTGAFEVDVIAKYYDTTTQDFTGRAVGSTFIPGESPVSTRQERVSIWNDAREVSARFTCSEHTDLIIQSLEYKGNFTQRGGRY